MSPKQGNAYAIVVEKSSQTLFLFAYNGTFRELHRFPCSTGVNPGPKSHSGDSKTPEGVYFFIKEHPKKYLASIYGTRAFPMDYPNLMDQLAGRDGNSIWMHGTNKPLKPQDSNGCVVLANRDIDVLSKYIVLNRTPIVVVDKLTYHDENSATASKNAVFEFLSNWNNSLQQGTYHQYLNFYDPEYLPNILWWTDWYQLKNGNNNSDEKISLALDMISVVKQNDTFVVLFDQTLRLPGNHSPIGTRKLFIKDNGRSLRIVADEFQMPVKESKDYPLVAVYRKLTRPVRKSSGVEEMVDGWLKAWSAKDIRQYGKYYAKGFYANGKNRKAWLRYKNRLNKKYDFIKVAKENLAIQEGKEKSIATFRMVYQSPDYKAKGTKRLVLIREDGQWKIFRETWKKR